MDFYHNEFQMTTIESLNTELINCKSFTKPYDIYLLYHGLGLGGIGIL